MPGSVRVTQDIVEAIVATRGNARVAQDVVEAIVAFDGGRAFAAVNGTALSFPGADTNSDTNVSGVTRRNRLSGFFYPKPGSNVVVHVGASGALNDAGNIGVIAVDGTDDHSQASPANSGNYTFAISATATKAYFVYSFLSSSYRAGLTGTVTYDKTVLGEPTGAAVTQDVIEAIIVDGGSVRVTQDIIEAIVSVDPGVASSSGGGQHSSVAFG